MPTPVTSLHAPGPGNVFIPAHGFQKDPMATGKAVIEYSRDPASYAINRYAQLIPGAPTTGYYPELSTADAIRVVNQQDFLWPDGDDAPVGTSRLLNWKQYLCERRAYPFMIGHLTRDMASYDVVASHARMAAMLAMTDRSVEAITALTTAATWGANTAATVDALTGLSGKSWDASSVADLIIKKSFHAVSEAINKATGGVIRPKDMMCIINPERAHTLSETAEVNQYIINNEQALPAWEQTGVYSNYGLPPMMYGIQIVVEDAVKVTSREGASTTATSYAMPTNQAVFVSRLGGITGVGGVNVSTCLGFMQEEMTIETKDDTDNRRIAGRVVENRDFIISSPASGYLIQDLTT